MNRYDLFRLVQDLGQLIEDAQEKTAHVVALELMALAQRKLTEARTVEAREQPMNGTTLPSPATTSVLSTSVDTTQA